MISPQQIKFDSCYWLKVFVSWAPWCRPLSSSPADLTPRLQFPPQVSLNFYVNFISAAFSAAAHGAPRSQNKTKLQTGSSFYVLARFKESYSGVEQLPAGRATPASWWKPCSASLSLDSGPRETAGDLAVQGSLDWHHGRCFLVSYLSQQEVMSPLSRTKEDVLKRMW